MRRLAGALLVCCAGVALVPGGASAHSLVRSGGGLVSYTSADATSLNGLAVRPSGNRVEFRDDRVDGGMDPGSCTPGALDAKGYLPSHDRATPSLSTMRQGPHTDMVVVGWRQRNVGGTVLIPSCREPLARHRRPQLP